MKITALKNVLQEKLKEKEINATELERKANLSSGSIRRILLGNSQNPTLETMVAIADVFGCSLDELIGKRIINKNQSNEILISEDVIWNNELMKAIFMETFEYIRKNNICPSLKTTINLILETYNFCLLKKNGTFDKDFYDWYSQQKLSAN